MNRTVRQGSHDPIRYRFMVDYEEPTITAQSVAILGTAGGELRAKSSNGVSVSGGLVTFDPAAASPVEPWLLATFSIGYGYIARFYATIDSIEHQMDVPFATIPRSFVSEVNDADCLMVASHIAPRISPTDGLKKYRQIAWEEIVGQVAAALHPRPFWRLLDVGILKHAHIYHTLWLWHKSNAENADPGSPTWEKMQEYRADFWRTLNDALSRTTVDDDGDNLVDTDEFENNNTLNWST